MCGLGLFHSISGHGRYGSPELEEIVSSVRAQDCGILYDITPPGMGSFWPELCQAVELQRGVWVGAPSAVTLLHLSTWRGRGGSWRGEMMPRNHIQKESRPPRLQGKSRLEMPRSLFVYACMLIKVLKNHNFPSY